MPRVDMEGQRFGRLTVMQFDHYDNGGNAYWLCRCDCGGEKVVRRWRLAQLGEKGTKSCGCYFYTLDENGKKIRMCRRCESAPAERVGTKWESGHSSYCRKCAYKIAEESKDRNPDIRLRLRAKACGLTLDEMKEKLKLQQGFCPVCLRRINKGNPLVADHHHESNTFREMICAKCNFIIGLSDESGIILDRIKKYIIKHKNMRENKFPGEPLLLVENNGAA